MDCKKLKVPELRKELEDRGLDSTGLKQALIDRLEAALAIPGSSIATPASSQLAKAAEPSVTHSDPAIAQAASATANSSNHKAIEFKASANGASAHLTELQKKQARAKRFGVELGEAEQKALRAERFGTSKSGLSVPTAAKSGTLLESANTSSSTSGEPTQANKSAILSTATPLDQATKAAELEKRRARAKRFELPVTSNDEEQAKKKARAERFGSSGEELAAGTKAVVPTSTKASNGVVKAVISEEEAAKRQARALRFATAPPASKAASSGTTAEQVKKLEDRKIRFGAGKAGETAAAASQQAGPSAQA